MLVLAAEPFGVGWVEEADAVGVGVVPKVGLFDHAGQVVEGDLGGDAAGVVEVGASGLVGLAGVRGGGDLFGGRDVVPGWVRFQ